VLWLVRRIWCEIVESFLTFHAAFRLASMRTGVVSCAQAHRKWKCVELSSQSRLS